MAITRPVGGIPGNPASGSGTDAFPWSPGGPDPTAVFDLDGNLFWIVIPKPKPAVYPGVNMMWSRALDVIAGMRAHEPLQTWEPEGPDDFELPVPSTAPYNNIQEPQITNADDVSLYKAATLNSDV